VSGCVVQESPATQVTQAPPLQTWFDPQAVPFNSGAPFTQTGTPVAHELRPAWQSGSGCPVQINPAVQAEQVPPLQTMFAPHDVPFGTAAPLMHCCVPVEQSCTPT
jgi:hypothetical protein